MTDRKCWKKPRSYLYARTLRRMLTAAPMAMADLAARPFSGEFIGLTGYAGDTPSDVPFTLEKFRSAWDNLNNGSPWHNS